MSTTTEAPPVPTPTLDERGRLVPLTDPERDAQAEAIIRALDAIQDGGDADPPGSDEAFLRAVDERRPHRPLFAGMY